jgi:hypothetical protein
VNVGEGIAFVGSVHMNPRLRHQEGANASTGGTNFSPFG